MLSRRLATLPLAAIEADTLASLVADEAVRALGGTRAALWLHRPALRALVLEQHGREVRSLPLTDEMAQVLLEGDEVWWLTPQAAGVQQILAERSFGPLPPARGPRIAGLALRVERGPVGLLLVEGLADLPRDAAELTAQVAAVLHTHDVLTSSRRHETQLEALYQTAGELSSKLELPSVLEAIVERARGLVGSAISYIMLVDRERSEIYMRVVSGVSSPGFANLRLPIGRGLGGMAAEREQAFYTSDYLTDARFTHSGAVDEEVRRERIRCILGTPLRASDEFLGVLFVADRMVRVFTDADVDVLASLAQHAALALENATLYERTTRALDTVSEANRVIEERNRQLARAAEAHRRVSEVVLAGQGLPGIAHVIADLVRGGHVAVLDDRQRFLAAAGADGDVFGRKLARVGLRPDAAHRRDVRRVLDAVGRSETALLAAQGADRTLDRLVVPVVARAEALESVWVAVDPDRLEDDRPLIEQAARVVALELLKERSVFETERRLRRELLDELLAERAQSDEILPRRARDLGVDLVRPHRLAVCAGPAAATPDQEDRQRRVRDDVIAALRRRPWCAFAAERGSRVVALLDADLRVPERDLARALDSVVGAEQVRAVLSAPCVGVGEYRSYFIAATRVLALFGAALRERVLALEEARVLMLLFREGREAEVRDFLETRLGPLLRRGAGSGELITTLSAWLDQSGSPGRVAAALHVHVNTVYYRLERLRELLGEDFDEPRRSLDLRVALLAHRLFNDLEDPSKPPGRNSEELSVLGAGTPA